MKRLSAVTLSVVAAALFAGCAHYRVNPELSSPPPAKQYRFSNLSGDSNSDSLFVILTFSGGGTRAAALAYGVLKELKATEIVWKGKKKALLDEVDLISSISGGSFTAMYYGLFGDRIFAEFETRFLKRDIQRELLHKLFQPLPLLRLASLYYDRIDMAADLYDETVFERKTYGDLAAAPRKPFLVINATNLYLGEQFEFTQDQFDLLGSDLNGVPVARAVAASSAFPLLLSPITFKNYGGDPAIARKKWVVNALKDYNLNRRRYVKAKNTLTYLDSKNHPYIHLMDGGLSDNIGMRAVISSLRDAPEGGLLQLVNNGDIERFLIVIVNAKNGPADHSDMKKNAPSIKDVALKTTSISMDNYSFESVEAVKDIADVRAQAEQAIRDCQELINEQAKGSAKGSASGKVKLPAPEKSVQFDIVEVSFDSITDMAEKQYFLNLPTSFTLAPDQVDRISSKAGELLKQSEEFQEALKELR